VEQGLEMNKDKFQAWTSLQQKNDWYDGFGRQLFSLVSDRDKRRYRELNLRLLAAIQQVTGCQVVLDSSKYVGPSVGSGANRGCRYVYNLSDPFTFRSDGLISETQQGRTAPQATGLGHAILPDNPGIVADSLHVVGQTGVFTPL
jgi:hypothetical protein